MIIAIDFDGTIVESAFPLVGRMKPNADIVIRRLAMEGHKILLWTCRTGAYLVDAQEFCRNAGIPIHAANEHIERSFIDGISNKVYYDVLIDDRQLGGIPDDWEEIYTILKRNMK